MSVPNNKINPWPGFVAVISGLVASLMLLMAILVLLLTQLGTLAANYAETVLAELLRRAEERQAITALEKIRGTGTGTKLGGALIGVSPVPTDPSPKISEIVLIFTERVNDIPEDERPAIAQALRELGASPEARWTILAFAPESDAVLRRSTFRLMVAVRNFVTGQGIGESRIELRLEPEPVSREPAPEGSIVVRVVPSRVAPAPRPAATGGGAGGGAGPGGVGVGDRPQSSITGSPSTSSAAPPASGAPESTGSGISLAVMRAAR